MLILRKSKDLIHHTEEEAYSVLVQFLIFATTLITITVLAVSTHNTYQYHFTSNIVRIFLQREPSYNDNFRGKYADIVTRNDWFNFFEMVFLKYWHSQDLETEKVFLKENFHVGVARLRQIRVKPNSCIINDVFNRYFNSCFVRYYDDAEDTQKNYKGYQFYTRDRFPVSKVHALMAKYNGPGYVVFLENNANGNQELLKKLKAINWIDRATRLVLIEFVLYNSNMNWLINSKLITEVLATGTLLNTYKISFLPIYSIWSIHRPISLITASLFYLSICYSTAEEVFFLRAYGFYNYVTNKWNLLDFAILWFAYIGLILSVVVPFRTDSRLYTVNLNPHKDIFIDDLCTWHEIFRFHLSVAAVLMWLKIFRFISFNLTMLRFSMAVSRSLKDILAFAVMFFIVFVAYSMLGLLLFSDIHPGFSNFFSALVTMMRMIMGDYQYQNIEKANSFLGPVFFISYILFIFFICLNMFLAVISDTYEIVRETVNKPQPSTLKAKLVKLWLKVENIFAKCCGPKKKQKADEEPEVDDLEVQGEPTENEALRGYISSDIYFSVLSSLEDVGVTEDLRQLEDEELKKLTDQVDVLEYELEQLIIKMDRVLQKLDAKYDEQKMAKSLGKI